MENKSLTTEGELSRHPFCELPTARDVYSSWIDFSGESSEDLTTQLFFSQWNTSDALAKPADSEITSNRPVTDEGNSLADLPLIITYSEDSLPQKSSRGGSLTESPETLNLDSKVQTREVEDVLNDMLNECFQELPLSAWPLQPPVGPLLPTRCSAA